MGPSLSLREVNQEDPGEAPEHHSQAAAAGGDGHAAGERRAAGPHVRHQTAAPAPGSTTGYTAGSTAPAACRPAPPRRIEAEDRAQHPGPQEAAFSGLGIGLGLPPPSRRGEREWRR